MGAGIDTMTEQQELNDALRYERGLGYSEGYKAAREAVEPLVSSERVRRDMINCQTPKGYLKENEPYIEVLQATSLAEMYCKIYEAKLDEYQCVYSHYIAQSEKSEAQIDALTAQVAQLQEQLAQRGQWEPVGDAFEYHCQCGDCLDGDENAWQHKIYTNGSGIGIMYADESNAGSYVVTPTDLALCRLTPGAAAGEWKNVEADSETYIDGEDGQRYIIGVDSDGNMYVESRQPRRVLVALSSDDWRLQRRVRPVQSEVVSVPKDAADAADRVLNRLAGMFGDDAGNMPDQLHDDYLTVRTWLDALPAGWKGVGDGS